MDVRLLSLRFGFLTRRFWRGTWNLMHPNAGLTSVDVSGDSRCWCVLGLEWWRQAASVSQQVCDRVQWFVLWELHTAWQQKRWTSEVVNKILNRFNTNHFLFQFWIWQLKKIISDILWWTRMFYKYCWYQTRQLIPSEVTMFLVRNVSSRPPSWKTFS